MKRCSALLALALLCACPEGTMAPPVCSDGSAMHAVTADEHRSIAQSFMPRLVGTWGGPATGTPLGDFKRLTMDQRAVGSTVFGRADVDDGNLLRFSFSLEDREGPTFVFRNGGRFLNIDRDTRTSLREANTSGTCLRFCAVEGGCDYINALWEMPGDAKLSLNANVKKRHHLLWQATTLLPQNNSLPSPLEVTAADAPLPTLQGVDVTFTLNAFQAYGDAWVIFADRSCVTDSSCVSLRQQHRVPMGALPLTFHFDQLPAGTYVVFAFIDHNIDFKDTLAPGPGEPVTAEQTVILGPGEHPSISLNLP